MKKPDNVVDNPSLMPYPTNLGAPSFIPNDITTWKNIRIFDLNKSLSNRYEDLKYKIEEFQNDIEINKLLYSSNFNFEPIIGKEYHLYLNNNNEYFLSLIANDEWGRKKPEYIGSYKLDWQNKWNKI
jgi:hypothetical protein